MSISNASAKRSILSLAVAAAITVAFQANASAENVGDSVRNENLVDTNKITSTAPRYWELSGSTQSAENNTLTLDNVTLAEGLPEDTDMVHILLSGAASASASGNNLTMTGVPPQFPSAITFENLRFSNVDSATADGNTMTLSLEGNSAMTAVGLVGVSNVNILGVQDATVTNSVTQIANVLADAQPNPGAGEDYQGGFWTWGVFVSNAEKSPDAAVGSARIERNSMTLLNTTMDSPQAYVYGIAVEHISDVQVSDNTFALDGVKITEGRAYIPAIQLTLVDTAALQGNLTRVSDLTVSNSATTYIHGFDVSSAGKVVASENVFEANGVTVDNARVRLLGGVVYSSDEAVFSSNKMTVNSLSVASVATAENALEVAVSGFEARSVTNVEAVGNTLVLDGPQLNGADLMVFGGLVDHSGQSQDARSSATLSNNSIVVKNVTAQNGSAESLVVDGIVADTMSDVAVDSTVVNLENIGLSTTVPASGNTGSYLSVSAVRIYDADSGTATGNRLVAEDVHAYEATLGSVSVTGGVASSVSLIGNSVSVDNTDTQSDSDFDGGLTIYGARAGIGASAEISENTVSVKNVTAGKLSLYGGRYLQTEDSSQNATVLMNGNAIALSGVTSEGVGILRAAYLMADDDGTNTGLDATMTGNQLTLSESEFKGALKAYGASAYFGGSADISGNTVKLDQVTSHTRTAVTSAIYDQTENPSENASVVMNDNVLDVSNFTAKGLTELNAVVVQAEREDGYDTPVLESVSVQNNAMRISESTLATATDEDRLSLMTVVAEGTDRVEARNTTLDVYKLTASNGSAPIDDGDSGNAQATYVQAVLLFGEDLTAADSYVNVAESTFEGRTQLIGAQLEGGSVLKASDTQVTVSDTTFTGETMLYGVSAVSEAEATVADTLLNLSDVTLSDKAIYLGGASLEGQTLSVRNTLVNATNVKMTESDGVVAKRLCGVEATVLAGGTFSSSNTVVSVSNSKFNDGYVAGSFVLLADDGQVEINDQTVVVSGSTVDAVYGTRLVGDGNVSARINNQTIVLDNATVVGGVYDVSVKSETSTRSGNDVELTNSRLQLSGTNTVGSISGFDTIGLNVTEANKEKAVLTVTDADAGQMEFNGVTIEIASDDFLESSDTYQLINVEGGKYTFKDLTVKESHTFLETTYTADGDVVLGNGENLTSENDLFNNKTVKATESSKTLAESLLGTVAFINQGAEFIADEGIAAMVDAAKLGEVTAFGVMQGGSTHYNTGSYVDVDGVTFMAGAGLRVNPNWTLAGFVEAGWANSASHVEGARGDGDHEYFGVGFATRYQTDGVFYVDGSLRAGRATTEFAGRYGQDSASYDAKSLYMSAHVGLGAMWDLSECLKLDTYARYMVTYLDDDDVSLNNRYNDKLDLDSTVTHAVRAGARLLGDFNDYASWKVGAAYEHVFDGDAESAVNSFSLDVPSLEGDTGVFELGLRIRPSLESNWAVDLGAKGYVGDREGVTGNMTVRYSF